MASLAANLTTLERFTSHTFTGYQWNWHHRLIAESVDRLFAGRLPEGKTRLMIQTPPRHGKSELASRRAPALYLARNRSKRVIATSYSAGLASTFSGDVKRIVESSAFRECAGNFRLGKAADAGGTPEANRANEWTIPGHGGGYYGTGLRGGMTGRGFDFGIIDDPYKNREEAESEATRDRVWKGYASDFCTRDDGDGLMLYCATPWHEDGLAARILKEEGDLWHRIRLPAEADEPDRPAYDPRKDGEALWPERFPMAKLAAMKRLSPYTWEGLYQCRPRALGGGLFKIDNFKRYTERPPRFDQIIQSWDLTFKKTKSGSFIVGQVWGKAGADCYLLDQVRFRGDFVENLQAFRALSLKWPRSTAKLVEAKANGEALASALQREIVGIILVQPDGGKVERAHAVSPLIAAGNVYLPDRAEFMPDLLGELAGFPQTPHDDQVDALTQALAHFAGDPLAHLMDLTGGW